MKVLPSNADPCIWLRKAPNLRCYEYIAVFVDRIPSTTPGEEPPRDARDSGSARSHSTHPETSSSDRPKWSSTWVLRRYQAICPLSARNGRYVCQISRAHRMQSRP